MLEFVKVAACTHFPGMKADNGKSSKGVNLEASAEEDAIFLDEEAISVFCKKCEVVRVGFASESKSVVSENEKLRLLQFEF